jgi:mannosyl-glycoprotein endo-beta-N-acetylglucosaminidase
LYNWFNMFKAGMKRSLIGLMVFILIVPATANASGYQTSGQSDDSLEETKSIVEIIFQEDVALDSGISFAKGQTIFGQEENEKEVKIQVGLEEAIIPLDSVEISEEAEMPVEEYGEYDETVSPMETIILESPLELRLESTDEVVTTVINQIKYPILEETDDKYKMLLGNRTVYVSKEGLKQSGFDNDTSTEEEVSEDPKETTDEASTKEPVTTDENELNEEESPDNKVETVTEDEETVEESVEKDETSAAEQKKESFITAASETSSITFEQAGYLKPITSTLSIYDNSTGSLVKVGDLVDDQSYKIIETSGNWHKVKFGKGYGYVWKDSTVPSLGEEIKNASSGHASNLYEVHSDVTLAVYDNTSGSLVQMGNISPGVNYPVIGEMGNWLKVEFANRIGYIYEPATKKVYTADHKFFTVNNEFLSIYDNSTGKLVKVGALEQGQQYPITAFSGNWIKIKFGSGYGFVWKDSTEPVTTHSLKNLNNGLKNNGRYVISDVYLSVYDNTSGSLVKFGAIDPRVSYPVIDRSGNWYRIDFSGRIGYIYAPSTYMDFLPGDQYFEVRNESSAVYATANSSTEKIGTLVKGETFKRIGESGDFHKINFGNSYGYVLKRDTSLGYEGNFIPAVNPGEGVNTFITKQDVPVMDNSTGKLIKFAEIKSGVTYPYVGRAGNWVEINLGNRTGFVYDSGVQIGPILRYTQYDYTFDQAVDIQLSKAPQNDTSAYDAYVRSDSFSKIENGYGFANDVWNVRGGPGTNYWKLNSSSVVASNGPLIAGEKVEILGEEIIETSSGATEKWYRINFYRTYRPDGNGGYKSHYRAFVNASPFHTEYYMNPSSFVSNETARFQFLLLSESADASAGRINSVMLTDRGNLSGKGEAFVQAGKMHRINEIYLVSHSILETGAGSTRESQLLKGYKVNSIKGEPVPEKTVYNVYGIAAYDSCPGSPAICAAEFAYEQGWFSVDAAIIGGAEFIGETYIHRANNQQDTLYKMRWNPQIPGSHQYATDVGWAYKQAVNYFSHYYSLLGLKPKTFDIPVYASSGGK